MCRKDRITIQEKEREQEKMKDLEHEAKRLASERRQQTLKVCTLQHFYHSLLQCNIVMYLMFVILNNDQILCICTYFAKICVWTLIHKPIFANYWKSRLFFSAGC